MSSASPKILARVANVPGVVEVDRVIVPGGDYIKITGSSITATVVYLDGSSEVLTLSGTIQLKKRVARILIPSSERSKNFVIEVGKL
jgi:lipopolysaccharide export system protein LptA